MAQQYLSFAHQLADISGSIIRPYFGQDVKVALKADQSPVSVADQEAEAAIRAAIVQHFPEHGIFGEEFGQQAGGNASRASEPSASGAACQVGQQTNLEQTKLVWVIDPIDGTRAFLAGRHEWGTLIALCENGVPILGIFNQPVTGERWVGGRGATSTYNGAPIAPRECADLKHAAISTTSKNYFTPPQAKAFVKLAEHCGEVIENGDCYAYGLVARGERDIVVDAGLKPYDILALVPIINGAGGKITAWDGAPITLKNASTALAVGDATLHAAAQKFLAAG